MIKIETMEIVGLKSAIYSMRNPLNSWDKSDSQSCYEMDCDVCRFGEANDTGFCEHVGEDMIVGPNDLKLMNQLASGGPVHAKYRRMIQVYVDITAPLYWWKEMDTYKIGTVTNSCSTMHKIHERDLTIDDFSYEHLIGDKDVEMFEDLVFGLSTLKQIISTINGARKVFLKTNDKKYWWQMIQLLPTSYNQKRTWMANYEVLANIYHSRKDHKLDEWREFCKWIEKLPYSEIIIGAEENKNMNFKGQDFKSFINSLSNSHYTGGIKVKYNGQTWVRAYSNGTPSEAPFPSYFYDIRIRDCRHYDQYFGGDQQCYKVYLEDDKNSPLQWSETKDINNQTLSHQQMCQKLTALYEKKNHDYGDSFHKSFEEWGMPMVCIRLADKYNRLASLCGGKDQMVADEALSDTLMDLANYAIMALIELKKSK